MSYLRNAWYMIAWSEEIGVGPLVRTALEIPLLLIRASADGPAVALLDRCPHRFAPLSMGTIVNGEITCRYHGLQFNMAGHCVRSPFSKAVPAAARVRSFPVVEQDGIAWVWMGDQPPADQASIPRMPHHTDPELRCVHGLTTARADYRLLVDNLMDLTHTASIHPAFGGEHYRPKNRAWEDPDGSIVSDYVIERMPNFIGPAMTAEFVRHEDRIRWIAPAVQLLTSRTTGDGIVSSLHSAHILTPESPTSTHYFWSSAVDRDWPLSDEEHFAMLTHAFNNEDKPMVEAVQHRMAGADLWDLNPILLATDNASVRVRRKLTAMIEAEARAAAIVDAPAIGMGAVSNKTDAVDVLR